MTTAQQLGLWDTLPVYTSCASRRDQTIQERFEAFHAANPWVLEALERLTRRYLQGRRRKLGIKMLFELVRWHYAIETDDFDGFKLNNNYTSRYVRLMVERNPMWQDLFQTRELQVQ